MTISADSTSTLRSAKIQRNNTGQLLGAAIFIDADIIEPYVDGAESIRYELKAVPGGIMIEIGGDPV